MKYITPCVFSFLCGVLLSFYLIEQKLEKKKEEFKQEVKEAATKKYADLKDKVTSLLHKDETEEVHQKAD